MTKEELLASLSVLEGLLKNKEPVDAVKNATEYLAVLKSNIEDDFSLSKWSSFIKG